ncbi:Os08g0309225 [Oryza sativa Japonica Group]|uniref:Os08g0309225 protein n=1 Tax=Oryza sativa subsp. japonica TaxID=39947 RepID=C7J5Z8_ORYSJ|nr:Os08g0309225 [Oryza sativa Japonica Group]|eukprot:NP_001175512.1 Os08g0309225 [Oryza sativa Japonica Group]
MALAAALARAATAAGPLFLRARPLAPCTAAPAPALSRRRSLLSGAHTADEPPPPTQPPPSKLPDAPGAVPPLPWRAAEAEIVRDIDPVVQLIKDILHSDRPAPRLLPPSTSLLVSPDHSSPPADVKDSTACPANSSKQSNFHSSMFEIRSNVSKDKEVIKVKRNTIPIQYICIETPNKTSHRAAKDYVVCSF